MAGGNYGFDWPHVLMLVIVVIVFGSKLFWKWHKLSKLQQAVRRLKDPNPAPNPIVRAFNAVDPKLRTGVFVIMLLTLQGLVPGYLTSKFGLSERLSTAIALAAKMMILTGAVRMLHTLPWQKMFKGSPISTVRETSGEDSGSKASSSEPGGSSKKTQ
mmetsp:Transcript_152773/g.269603  ORF Transcript_152773/g.269603 Transcript_152773/m.269603 type:complete len:158 (-) Transcript_152773:8-481(-)